MDIKNPDLTKKVLAALNPNKIVSEDKLDKQISIVRKMWPSQESQKEKVLQQSIDQLDKEIEIKFPEGLISKDNFNLEYLNSIKDKDDFLKFVDTIYSVYPKIPNKKDAEYLFQIMNKAINLYQYKFVRIPYSLEPLNSKNFDRLFDLTEELRKKLGYPAIKKKRTQEIRNAQKPVPINSRTNIQKQMGINYEHLQGWKNRMRNRKGLSPTKGLSPVKVNSTRKKSLGKRLKKFFTKKNNNANIKPANII